MFSFVTKVFGEVIPASGGRVPPDGGRLQRAARSDRRGPALNLDGAEHCQDVVVLDKKM